MYETELNEHINVFNEIINLEKIIDSSIAKIISAISNGNKLLIAGNGGSAADAQHLAAEFIGRFAYDRSPIPALAITTDTSILTCISNDYAYDQIFTRQLTALSKPGDVLILISTSGNSQNLLNAAALCSELKIHTIGLLGRDGGKLKNLVGQPIIVPSSNTARIQEAHIFIGHYICGEVEKELRPQNTNVKERK